MGKINLSYLEDITSSESEIMIEMIDLMLDEIPKHITNLKQASDKQYWDEIKSGAHKLKPMFLYMGLKELNQIAQKLEDFGKKEENLEEIPDLIKNLEAGFNEVIPELKEKRKELS